MPRSGHRWPLEPPETLEDLGILWGGGRAELRVMVKRILRGYPTDKPEAATNTVLQQAELGLHVPQLHAFERRPCSAQNRRLSRPCRP